VADFVLVYFRCIFKELYVEVLWWFGGNFS